MNMTKRRIVKVEDEVFSKITRLMMEAHRNHELVREEAIGYVIAREPEITVGMVQYVIHEMAEAFAGVGDE
jgi:predicted transcriptional regulator